MAVTNDKPAPYATTSALLDLISRHRSRGLPSPVNAEVLGRAGVSDSLIPRTLIAMQTLDLIDENGQPTSTFESIRLAPEAEYKQRLEEWLNSAYADVILFVNPGTDDEVKVRDAFRSYQPISQQPRMVSLFLGLYEAAGIAPEKSSQPRTARSTTPRPRAASVSPAAKINHRKTLTNSGSPDIPAPLAGLLASLPQDANGWSKVQRDKFVTTFGAVLDFCFPIIEDEPQSDSQDDVTKIEAAAIKTIAAAS
jgi:hypothetical protein